jgi:hypothetical protein
MSIHYNIYWNNGSGGAVDDSTPLATVAGLSWTSGALAPSSDATFLVRAVDTGTGLEEANTEATARVVTGPEGEDLSGLPGPPQSLSLAAAPGGGCRVSWAFAASSAAAAPAEFLVYLSPGGSVDYSAPAASVPFMPGTVGYSCVLAGPYPPSAHTAGVRSSNAAGAEANMSTATAALGLSAVSYALDPVDVDFV